MHHSKFNKVVGIDLAGSPKRDTGICSMKSNTVIAYTTLHSDEEIVAWTAEHSPTLAAIDAPLILPPGRKSIDDRNGMHFRVCDTELKKRKIAFFPITLGPMRSLTTRGILLSSRLKAMGIDVIEVYPGAAQDIWKIPRKQEGLDKLIAGLRRIGIKGLNRKMNGDELDAVTGAAVGVLFLRGKAEVLGNFEEGAIVVPYEGTRPE